MGRKSESRDARLNWNSCSHANSALRPARIARGTRTFATQGEVLVQPQDLDYCNTVRSISLTSFQGNENRTHLSSPVSPHDQRVMAFNQTADTCGSACGSASS